MPDPKISEVGENGTNADVMQLDPVPMTTVPVHVEGPVLTKALPSLGGAEFVQMVLTKGAAAVRILNKDPQRRHALIVSSDTSFFIGSSQAQAGSSSACLWPNGVVLPLSATSEIWARSSSGAADATLNIVTEREF